MKQLEVELKVLTGKVTKDLKKKLKEAVRVFKDTGEDSELSMIKDRQSFNDNRIVEINEKICNAKVVLKKSYSTTEIQFGSKVFLESDKHESLILKIVGIDEANIRLNKISIDSPLAHVLLGKKIGDPVELRGPNGKVNYTVVKLTA